MEQKLPSDTASSKSSPIHDPLANTRVPHHEDQDGTHTVHTVPQSKVPFIHPVPSAALGGNFPATPTAVGMTQPDGTPTHYSSHKAAERNVRQRAVNHEAYSAAGAGVPMPAPYHSHRKACKHAAHRDNEAQVLHDSFGNVAYECMFDQPSQEAAVAISNRAHAGEPPSTHPGNSRPVIIPSSVDVPWELRDVADETVCHYFAFLSKRRFWFLVEYACRVTFIAMLVPAAIVNADLHNPPFISSSFVLTSVVISTGTSVGQTSMFFVQFIKAACIWLPLATICTALKLSRYNAAWFVVYVVVLFLQAVFTEKTTRRMCLLLYNISMVVAFFDGDGLTYPSRLLVDWLIGAAFSLAASLVPYPLLATRASRKISKRLFTNTSTCFSGFIWCFWARSNTERIMSMVRVRSLVKLMDDLLDQFDKYDAFTFYEVLFFERYERREVRKEKVKLIYKLKLNLRAMEHVINIIQERPQLFDDSDRCLLFREYLSRAMTPISRAVELLLANLSAAKYYSDLRSLGPLFDACGHGVKELQDDFNQARQILFYEHSADSKGERVEEFVPLMTFFVFSVVNFWATLRDFQTFVECHKRIHDWRASIRFVFQAVVDPFIDNAKLVHLLIVRHAEPEVRVVIEAVKVSVSMLIAAIFFYYVDIKALLLAGPTIIAFVSGTNPVEATQASAARLFGTLVGSVLGFFAASFSHNGVDRVISLCVITFVMSFMRVDQPNGTVYMYCNFVAIASLGPEGSSAENIVTRIQQNAFAIFIYCFISVAFFPVSPNAELLRKRLNVLSGVSALLDKFSGFFTEASKYYVERCALRSGNEDSTNGADDQLASATLLSMNGNQADFATFSPMNHSALLPQAFTTAPEDKMIEQIYSDVHTLLDLAKSAAGLLLLASKEFQVLPKLYPLRASSNVQDALNRTCALVYIMTCSWKLMRRKGYFTAEMIHLFHNLSPVMADINQIFLRFTHILAFYVKSPSCSVSSELTKTAMHLRMLCVEVNLRKERDLMAIIHKTVLERASKRKQGSDRRHRHHHHNNNGHDGDAGSTDSSRLYSSPTLQLKRVSSEIDVKALDASDGSTRELQATSAHLGGPDASAAAATSGQASLLTLKNLQSHKIGSLPSSQVLPDACDEPMQRKKKRAPHHHNVPPTRRQARYEVSENNSHEPVFGDVSTASQGAHTASTRRPASGSAACDQETSEAAAAGTRDGRAAEFRPSLPLRQDTLLTRAQRLREKIRQQRRQRRRRSVSSASGSRRRVSLGGHTRSQRTSEATDHLRRVQSGAEHSLSGRAESSEDADLPMPQFARDSTHVDDACHSSRCSRGTSDDASTSDECSSASSSSSYVFNSSFTTPITVEDAEGIHAFTISLEMLSQEVRKTLFGIEEIVQSEQN